MKNNFLFLSLVVLLLTSCSVEKRVYNKGYHVAKNTHVKVKSSTYVPKAILEQKKEKPIEQFFSKIGTNEIAKEPIFTSTQRLSVDAPKSAIKPIPVKNPCDSIVLKNGERKLIKVIQINDSIIEFSDCKDPQITNKLSLQQVDLLVLKSGELFSFQEFKYKNNPQIYYEPKSVLSSKEKTIKILSIVSFSVLFLGLLFFVFAFFFLGYLGIFGALGFAFISLVLGTTALALKPNRYPNIKQYLIFALLAVILSSLLIIGLAVYLALTM